MTEPERIAGDWGFMKKIGATPSTKPFEPIPIRHGITGPLKRGESFVLQDVPEQWKHGQIFLDDQSLPFVLYISDQDRVYQALVGYRFHFKWCSHLAKMHHDRRDQRYRAKYDICNPAFEINDGNNEALNVCKKCCSEFSSAEGSVYRHFGANRWNIVDKFRMPEFFEKFGITNLPPSRHPGGRDGYTRNWPKVARREKEKAGWRCQDRDCDKDCSNAKQDLHVHHKNGVKSDNVSDNLEVVCRTCHAQKPGHGHMKP